MSSEREDRPPKRKQSSNIDKNLQSSSKHLKNNAKQSIPLKTTLQLMEEFCTSIESLIIGRHNWIRGYDRVFQMNPQSIAMNFGGYDQRAQFTEEKSRHMLYEGLSSHVFPILSLKRHYFNTLKKMDISLCFHPFKEKDLQFLSRFLTLTETIPNLKSLTFTLYSVLQFHDFEEMDLLLPFEFSFF